MLGSRVRFSCYHMYNILSKAAAKAQPSVLYCVSKQLDLTKDQKARVEKDRVIGRCSFDASGDPFGYWISTADIRFCKYDESHKIMGRTFGMCVLQDFNGLTPNILARSIETVEGGGIILVLLRDAEMWEDVFHMSMDVHKRFRTHAWQDVVGRFNERFVLSLAQTPNVLFLDSHLEVLGVSSYAFNVTPVPPSISANSPSQEELRNLKLSLRDVQPAGKLISITTTLDQAQAVLTFLDAISDKALHTTVTLTAARGRGKSAALGLAITGAIVMGYSNVYVTAPSPDNLRTVFEFVIRGFDALGFHEHQDFNIIQSENVDLQKPVVRINIFRAHRQTIQYISPTDAHKLGQAELLVIDEAAAIPLPLVKALLGPYLVFLSSTINGYEGTGRSLSLKLIKQLRQQSAHAVAAQAASQSAEKVKNEMAVANRGYLPRMPKPLTEQQAPEEVPPEETDLSATTTESTSTSTSTSTSAQPLSAPSAAAAGNIQHMISGVALSSASSLNRILREVSLEEPIRYSVGDPIESWLNELLCLNASSKLQPLKYGAPHPSECQLFYVTRDSLFSYHKLSEDLLQQIMGLLVTSHYKNSPNDLQLLSDAPAHHLFALLGPVHDLQQLPDVLVVIQVALEGKISIDAVEKMAKSHLKGEFGDLIPWTLSQQFQDNEFPSLSGARVVRIAAHPDYNRMGYASYALQELLKYYQGDIALADELVADSVAPTTEAEKKYALKSELQPRKNLPPLLLQLSQRRAEALNYVGVAYGISPEVCNFWIKNGFSPVYLRQVSSDITGEFSCIMLRQLKNLLPPKVDWLSPYVVDFRTRFSFLLGYAFRTFSTSLALRLLVPDGFYVKLFPLLTTFTGKIICRSQITGKELKLLMSQHDIRRLKS
ncbi:N-acetyltransferase 10 [Pelomyxa schiedti]|nr:N-acetyltransferase 10 [Pelomyxa schiedti]